MHPDHESIKLAERLLRIVDMITKIVENNLPDDAGSHLRVNQMRTLYLLKYEPGISQKDLAARLKITPAAVSNTVRDMESMGLLSREPDQKDARQNQLYLSEKGLDLISEGENLRYRAVAKLLNELPIDEQRSIVESLENAFESFQSEKHP